MTSTVSKSVESISFFRPKVFNTTRYFPSGTNLPSSFIPSQATKGASGPVPPMRRTVVWLGDWISTTHRPISGDSSPGKEMVVVFCLPEGEKAAGSTWMVNFRKGTPETGFPVSAGVSTRLLRLLILISAEEAGGKGCSLAFSPFPKLSKR
jgi:hypothetical protein